MPSENGSDVGRVRAFASAFLVGLSAGSATSAGASPQQASATAGGRYGRALRLAAVLFVLSLLSYRCTREILKFLAAAEAAGLTVGAIGLTFAVIASTGRDLLLAFERFWSHVRTGMPGRLFDDYARFGFTLSAILAPILAIQMRPAPGAASPDGTLTRPAFLVAMDATQHHYPFLFELADGPASWSRGVDLSEQQKLDVGRIAATLTACGGSAASQAVVVEVVGFADANDFRSVAADRSLELNLETANRRAANLAAALTAALDTTQLPPWTDQRVIVKRIVRWTMDDPLAMVRSGRYLSAKALAETDGRDQGRLNRRAEIALLRAGICSPTRVADATELAAAQTR